MNEETIIPSIQLATISFLARCDRNKKSRPTFCCVVHSAVEFFFFFHFLLLVFLNTVNIYPWFQVSNIRVWDRDRDLKSFFELLVPMGTDKASRERERGGMLE